MKIDTVVDNTNSTVLRDYWNEIITSLRNTNKLPKELEDLFTVKVVTQHNGNIAAVLNWA